MIDKMDKEALAVLDQLFELLSIETAVSIANVGRKLRIPPTPDYTGTDQSIDMDMILLNFPFLN